MGRRREVEDVKNEGGKMEERKRSGGEVEKGGEKRWKIVESRGIV